jgi:hypothetical protein
MYKSSMASMQDGLSSFHRTWKFERLFAAGCLAVTFLPAMIFAANVTVNVSSNLAVVPATGYGIHTSVYAGIFGDKSLPGALSRGGISTLRYPGGGYADVFHWSASRPAFGQNNGFGFSPWWGQSGSIRHRCRSNGWTPTLRCCRSNSIVSKSVRRCRKRVQKH